MKNNIKILLEKLKTAQSIAVSGHKNPDGDSLCSALAIMKLVNLNFDKRVTVIYDGNIPQELENVPSRKSACFHKHVPEGTKFDLYILVDYGTRKNLGGAEPFIKEADFIIEFDHHYNEDKLGNLCFDDVEKASTSQIIYDVIRESGLEINQEIVDLLTLALITDTGNFKFVRHSDVFKDAAELVDAGANMMHLVNILNNKDRKTVLVESKAVSNAEFFMKNRLVIATINRDDYKQLDGRGELVLRLLGQIHGVQYIVLLKEQRENQIGISLRSRDNNKPINQIAEAFGGGGHLCAAGAVVIDSLENVKTKVIEAFKGL